MVRLLMDVPMSQGGCGGVVRSLLWRERWWQRQWQGFTNGKSLAMVAVDDAMMCNLNVGTDVRGKRPGAWLWGESVTSGAVRRSTFEEEVQVRGRHPWNLEEDNGRPRHARDADFFGQQCVWLEGKLGQCQQRIGIGKFRKSLQVHDGEEAQFKKPTGSSILERGLHVEGGVWRRVAARLAENCLLSV